MAEDKNYLYLGVDVHKHSSTITVMDEDGKRLVTEKLPNTREAFVRLLNSFGDNYFRAVLEAGRNWGVIYDLLENLPKVENVVLANPLNGLGVKSLHSTFISHLRFYFSITFAQISISIHPFPQPPPQ